MNLQAIIGHAELIFHDPAPGHMSRPITAHAEKGVTMPFTATPTLTDSDLRQAVADGLRRKFRKVSPQGQEIGEIPIVEDVVRESGTGQPEVVYRFEGQYWKAPFLINPDRTVTVGEGVPVARNWTALSAMRRTDLEREVIAYFKPLKAAGDLDPIVKEVRAKDEQNGSVIALFAGAYYEMPFLFDGPKCWVSTARPVERDGATATFRPPSNKTGGDIVAATDMIIAAVRKMGRQIRYGDAQIIAAQLTDRSCPTTKSELEPLLGKVFAMIAEEERRHPAKRGGTR